jgi:hypothetical protein
MYAAEIAFKTEGKSLSAAQAAQYAQQAQAAQQAHFAAVSRSQSQQQQQYVQQAQAAQQAQTVRAARQQQQATMVAGPAPPQPISQTDLKSSVRKALTDKAKMQAQMDAAKAQQAHFEAVAKMKGIEQPVTIVSKLPGAEIRGTPSGAPTIRAATQPQQVQAQRQQAQAAQQTQTAKAAEVVRTQQEKIKPPANTPYVDYVQSGDYWMGITTSGTMERLNKVSEGDPDFSIQGGKRWDWDQVNELVPRNWRNNPAGYVQYVAGGEAAKKLEAKAYQQAVDAAKFTNPNDFVRVVNKQGQVIGSYYGGEFYGPGEATRKNLGLPPLPFQDENYNIKPGYLESRRYAIVSSSGTLIPTAKGYVNISTGQVFTPTPSQVKEAEQVKKTVQKLESTTQEIPTTPVVGPGGGLAGVFGAVAGTLQRVFHDPLGVGVQAAPTGLPSPDTTIERPVIPPFWETAPQIITGGIAAAYAPISSSVDKLLSTKWSEQEKAISQIESQMSNIASTLDKEYAQIQTQGAKVDTAYQEIDRQARELEQESKSIDRLEQEYRAKGWIVGETWYGSENALKAYNTKLENYRKKVSKYEGNLDKYSTQAESYNERLLSYNEKVSKYEDLSSKHKTETTKYDTMKEEEFGFLKTQRPYDFIRDVPADLVTAILTPRIGLGAFGLVGDKITPFTKETGHQVTDPIIDQLGKTMGVDLSFTTEDIKIKSEGAAEWLATETPLRAVTEWKSPVDIQAGEWPVAESVVHGVGKFVPMVVSSVGMLPYGFDIAGRTVAEKPGTLLPAVQHGLGMQKEAFEENPIEYASMIFAPTIVKTASPLKVVRGTFETGAKVRAPKYLNILGEAVEKPVHLKAIGLAYESPILSVKKLIGSEPRWAGYETGGIRGAVHLGGAVLETPFMREITVKTYGIGKAWQSIKEGTVYKLKSEAIAKKVVSQITDPQERAAYLALYRLHKTVKDMPDEIVVTHEPSLAINTAFLDQSGNLVVNAANMKQVHIRNMDVMYGSTLNEVLLGEQLTQRATGRLARDTELTPVRGTVEAARESARLVEREVDFPTHINEGVDGAGNRMVEVVLEKGWEPKGIEPAAGLHYEGYPFRIELDPVTGVYREIIDTSHEAYAGRQLSLSERESSPIIKEPQSAADIMVLESGFLLEDLRVQFRRKVDALLTPRDGQLFTRGRVGKDLFDLEIFAETWIEGARDAYRRTGERKYQNFANELQRSWDDLTSNPRISEELRAAHEEYGPLWTEEARAAARARQLEAGGAPETAWHRLSEDVQAVDQVTFRPTFIPEIELYTGRPTAAVRRGISEGFTPDIINEIFGIPAMQDILRTEGKVGAGRTAQLSHPQGAWGSELSLIQSAGRETYSAAEIFDAQLAYMRDLWGGVKPPSVRSLYDVIEEVERIPKGRGRELLDLIKRNDPDAVFGGSLGQAAQSKGGVHAIPKDVDLYVKDPVRTGTYLKQEFFDPIMDPALTRVTEGGGVEMLNPSTGKWYHVVDIHKLEGRGIMSMQRYVGRYGIKAERPIVVDGFRIMPLREQLLRKVSSTAELRRDPTTGEWMVSPELHRGKDVGDTLLGIRMQSASIEDSWLGQLGLREGRIRNLDLMETDIGQMLSEGYLPETKQYTPRLAAMERIAEFRPTEMVPSEFVKLPGTRRYVTKRDIVTAGTVIGTGAAVGVGLGHVGVIPSILGFGGTGVLPEVGMVLGLTGGRRVVAGVKDLIGEIKPTKIAEPRLIRESWMKTLPTETYRQDVLGVAPIGKRGVGVREAILKEPSMQAQPFIKEPRYTAGRRTGATAKQLDRPIREPFMDRPTYMEEAATVPVETPSVLYPGTKSGIKRYGVERKPTYPEGKAAELVPYRQEPVATDLIYGRTYPEAPSTGPSLMAVMLGETPSAAAAYGELYSEVYATPYAPRQEPGYKPGYKKTYSEKYGGKPQKYKPSYKPEKKYTPARKYTPSEPRYPPGKPTYPPGKPRYPPGKPTYPPGKPGYPPGKPQYPPEKPRYPPPPPETPPPPTVPPPTEVPPPPIITEITTTTTKRKYDKEKRKRKPGAAKKLHEFGEWSTGAETADAASFVFGLLDKKEV